MLASSQIFSTLDPLLSEIFSRIRSICMRGPEVCCVRLNPLIVSGWSGIRQLRWIREISGSDHFRPSVQVCLKSDGQTSQTSQPVSQSVCQTIQTIPDHSDQSVSKSDSVSDQPYQPYQSDCKSVSVSDHPDYSRPVRPVSQ